MIVKNFAKFPFRRWPLRNAVNWIVKDGRRLAKRTKGLRQSLPRFRALKLVVMHIKSTDRLKKFSIASYPGGPDELVALSRKLDDPFVATLIQAPETRIFRISSLAFEPHQDIFFSAGAAYRQKLGSGRGWRSLREEHSMHSHIVLWSYRRRILAATAKLNSAKHIESGIVVSGRFPSNFYHLLIGIYPKVFLMEMLKVVPESVPLLVSESIRSGPSEGILRLLVGSSRPIVFLPDSPHLVAEAYFVESPVPEVAHLPGRNPVPWHRLGSFNFSLMAEYRNFFIDMSERLVPDGQPEVGQRIFLKRSGPSRPFNDSEVEEMLIGQGFRVIKIEEFPFLEQVKIFSNARMIVSTTGAQWSGAIFAENAKCVIIQPDFLSGSSLFSKLLHGGNSELFEFPMEVRETWWNDYFSTKQRGHVDIDALKVALSSIGD
ncbi:glycosyltransferase family 61 protein [Pontimonas sp.]|nr:glycosyltransferase family 61 protein [Pontimonas sp.]